jgi:Site-specific recombinase XerD
VIDDQAAAVLGEWLAVRATLDVTGHKPIFCTLKGGRINPAQFREKLPRLATKAQIAKRVHCHSFRHSGASELAQEGVALLDIQHQLGHQSASTTDKYLHLLNPVARAERMRSRTW